MTDKKHFLAEIKKEIVKDIKDGKNSAKGLHIGSVMVTVVLAALLIFSVFQTVQSASILNKVKSGSFSSTSQNSSILPASLEDLPNMVGGC